MNNSTGAADGTWDANANSAVYSISISGTGIYAGGQFTSIGGQSRNYIAKLNNTTGTSDVTWNPNANVNSIAISGTDIYAGGYFISIGGQTRNYIAKLDNSTGASDVTWNPNANSYVYSIAISGTDIYAGGAFTNIGGQTRNNITKLNNSTGTADGTWDANADNTVWSIAISGTDIYACGEFHSIGGQFRDHFADIILSAPTVTTAAISNIFPTTATCGGNVTSDGGASVTARGVCWSFTTATPTISNSKTTDGTGTGVFTSSLSGLVAGTLYYARAYATNSISTSYGSTVSFTTPKISLQARKLIKLHVGESYTFTFSATDDQSNPYAGNIAVKDDVSATQYSSHNFSNGTVSHTVEVPLGKVAGIYPVKFSADNLADIEYVEVLP